ncbi:hypothetical protein DXG01_004344 [Tephrocybe rancida]|nr:hypothetical protein DXG01_004344 [Tephrocybe rancida]
MQGIQSVLFCICLYLLATRRNPAHLIILLSMITMFVISIADIVISYRWVIHDVLAVLKFKMTTERAVIRVLPKGYLWVTNNLIADGLLTYRCYKVWNNRKIIWVVAGVVLVADSGRIWWVARSAQPLLDSQQAKRYHTATAIIIESGAIYPLSVLLLTVTPPDKKYRIILLCIALRVVRHEDETDTSVVTRVQDLEQTPTPRLRQCSRRIYVTFDRGPLDLNDDADARPACSDHPPGSTNAEDVLPSDRVAVEENNDIASEGIIPAQHEGHQF